LSRKWHMAIMNLRTDTCMEELEGKLDVEVIAVAANTPREYEQQDSMIKAMM